MGEKRPWHPCGSKHTSPPPSPEAVAAFCAMLKIKMQEDEERFDAERGWCYVAPDRIKRLMGVNKMSALVEMVSWFRETDRIIEAINAGVPLDES